MAIQNQKVGTKKLDEFVTLSLARCDPRLELAYEVVYEYELKILISPPEVEFETVRRLCRCGSVFDVRYSRWQPAPPTTAEHVEAHVVAIR